MLNFKQIEKKIDPMVLNDLKNHCYEREYDRTEITELEPTKHGKKYRSVMIYKKVLNEDKYRKKVMVYYQHKVGPSQPKTTKRRESGKNITKKEFFETIYRNNFNHRKGEKDKKGRRIQHKSFIGEIDPELRIMNKQTVIHSMDKLLKNLSKYSHFTPNMFISHKSTMKDGLSLLTGIVLDFDLSNVGIVMSKEELFQYVKKKLKVEMSMIWDTKTKGNYQGIILIKPMVGTDKSIYLYEQIVREMIFKLGEIADLSGAVANHYFRIGQNNHRTGQYIRKYNENEHDIDEFRWLLNERDERRKKENSDNVIDFTTESIKRHPAIVSLYNGEVVGWRDHACFTLALVMRFLGHSEEQTENHIISKWIPAVRDKGDHPFTTTEGYKCIKHAYSGKYKAFHSDWVEKVTGLDCDLKGYFRRFKRNVNKGINITDTETRFKELLRENGSFIGSIPEIMEKIGVKKTALKEAIARMRENGELDCQRGIGRGAKTTYTMIEKQQEAQEEYVFESNYSTYQETINHLEELQESMFEMLGAS